MDTPPQPNRGRIVAAGILAAVLGALFLKIYLQRQRPAGEPLTPPSAPPATLRPRTGRDSFRESAPGGADPRAAPGERPTARQAARVSEAALGKILAAHSFQVVGAGRIETAGLLQSVHVGPGRALVVLSAGALPLIRDAALRGEVRGNLESALGALGYAEVTIRAVTAAGHVVDLESAAVED